MYKYLIILLIPFLLTAGTDKKKHHFRNCDWGMTMDEVINTEKVKLFNLGETKLMGKVIVENNPGMVIYEFDNDKLVKANYQLDTDQENPSKSIASFKRFKKLLIKNYGKPAESKIDCVDKNFLKDDLSIANGLMECKLNFQDVWELPETKIIMQLYKITPQTHLRILYLSKTDKNKTSSDESEGL